MVASHQKITHWLAFRARARENWTVQTQLQSKFVGPYEKATSDRTYMDGAAEKAEMTSIDATRTALNAILRPVITTPILSQAMRH